MKKKIYSKNMTIGSLKCYRCSKINCKKYYKCVNCDIICCKECLDETNPKRLTYKVFKNDKNGIEKTIYCPLHCSKKNNLGLLFIDLINDTKFLSKIGLVDISNCEVTN